MTPRIDILPADADMLGESAIWDDVAGCLYWVDSLRPMIRRYDPATGAMTDWRMPMPVGSIGLTDQTGHLVAALQDGFYDVDLIVGEISALAKPKEVAPGERFNDGKVDRQGRFVSGTLVGHGATTRGSLYSLGADLSIARLDHGVRISNALAFALDGRTMYYACSLERLIWAYDYNPLTGAVSGKRVFIDTSPLDSAPDGACIDASGCLWVTLVQIGQVACITPDGHVVRRLDLPCEFPTCPAFGGAALQTLYVTSISDSGTGRMVGTRPASGRVIAIDGLGCTGVTEPRFQLTQVKDRHV